MRKALVALAALVLLLSACDDGPKAPGESKIDVDTPELRELKADAGIEPCVPGPGGGPLGSLELPCLGGGPSVDLASLTGPLVINLWYSACGPCKKEMPALQEFHETYGDQVPLLGIDVTDTYPEAAIGLAQLTGATYPQLADPGGDLQDLDGLRLAAGYPQFIVIDADGGVSQLAGGFDTLDDVTAMVEAKAGVELSAP